MAPSWCIFLLRSIQPWRLEQKTQAIKFTCMQRVESSRSRSHGGFHANSFQRFLVLFPRSTYDCRTDCWKIPTMFIWSVCVKSVMKWIRLNVQSHLFVSTVFSTMRKASHGSDGRAEEEAVDPSGEGGEGRHHRGHHLRYMGATAAIPDFSDRFSSSDHSLFVVYLGCSWRNWCVTLTSSGDQSLSDPPGKDVPSYKDSSAKNVWSTTKND